MLIILFLLSMILLALFNISDLKSEQERLAESIRYEGLQLVELNTRVDKLGSSLAVPEGQLALKGNKGDRGVSGLPGAVGATGATGSQGIAGASGVDGTDGVDGANGTDGADGIDGASGPTGPQGPTGPAGPQGPQGDPGPTYNVIAGDGLSDSDAGSDVVLDINAGDGLTLSADSLKVLAADGTITVAGGGVAVGTIGDANIKFGTAAGEVSAGDIPIADSGLLFTATDVEDALQEVVISATAGDGLSDSGTSNDPIFDINAGGGLSLAADVLSVNVGTGLVISGGSVTLDNTCAVGEILKWNGASWVCASDASALAALDYIYAYKTGTQALTTGGTFENISFDNVAINAGITPSSGPTSTFTIAVDGVYQLSYMALTSKMSGPSNVVDFRLTCTGTCNGSAGEIAGSASAAQINKDTANNKQGVAVQDLIFRADAGDVIRLQFTGPKGGGGTKADTIKNNGSGYVSTNVSASLKIVQIN